MAALGLIEQARALGEDSRARLVRLLGADHPATLSCSANLALDLRALGAIEEADVLAAETAHRCARTLERDDPLAAALAAGSRAEVDFDPPPI